MSFLKHKHRNKHHWQYWVSLKNNGEIVAIEMPKKYMVEMWCDWKVVASMRRNNVKEWYYNNRQSIKLHHRTRQWIEDKLENLD